MLINKIIRTAALGAFLYLMSCTEVCELYSPEVQEKGNNYRAEAALVASWYAYVGERFSVIEDTSFFNNAVNAFFSSEDSTIVNVDSMGNCEAVRQGIVWIYCTIYYSADSMVTDSCPVGVEDFSVTVNGKKTSMVHATAGASSPFLLKVVFDGKVFRTTARIRDTGLAFFKDSSTLDITNIGTTVIEVSVHEPLEDSVVAVQEIPLIIEWEKIPLCGGEIAVDPVTGNLWCAADSQGLIIIDTGNVSWTKKSLPVQLNFNKKLYTIKIHSAYPEVRMVAVIDSSGHEKYYSLLISVDGGSSWVEREIPVTYALPHFVFHPKNRTTLFMDGIQGDQAEVTTTVFISTNLGETWDTLGTHPSVSTRLYINQYDPDLLYYSDRFFASRMSVDGGKTWNVLSDHTGNRENQIYLLTVTDKVAVLAQKYMANDDWPLLSSTDNGKTFKEIYVNYGCSVEIMTYFDKNPDILLATCSHTGSIADKFAVSDDGGYSWNNLYYDDFAFQTNIENAQNLRIVSSDPLEFYFTHNGQLWRYKSVAPKTSTGILYPRRR